MLSFSTADADEDVNNNYREHDQMSGFEKYLKQHYNVDNGSFFGRWDFDQIIRDKKQWDTPSDWLTLYCIVNAAPNLIKGSKKRTSSSDSGDSNRIDDSNYQSYIGCTAKMKQRLNQHRGEIPGGPPWSKKLIKDWRVFVKVLLPPIRNFSATELRQSCRNGIGIDDDEKEEKIRIKKSNSNRKNVDGKERVGVDINKKPKKKQTITLATAEELDQKTPWFVKCRRVIKAAINKGLTCKISKALVKKHYDIKAMSTAANVSGLKKKKFKKQHQKSSSSLTEAINGGRESGNNRRNKMYNPFYRSEFKKLYKKKNNSR